LSRQGTFNILFYTKESFYYKPYFRIANVSIMKEILSKKEEASENMLG
jgi:hypothetical protein